MFHGPDRVLDPPLDVARASLTAVISEQAVTTQEAFGELPLDRLLQTLDVRLSAFALLRVGSGYRLNFQGSSAPIIHFVLSGRGYMEFDAGLTFQIETGDIVILPPGCRKAVRPDAGPSIDVMPGNHCEMVSDGLLQVDVGADAQPGDVDVAVRLRLGRVHERPGPLRAPERPSPKSLET